MNLRFFIWVAASNAALSVLVFSVVTAQDFPPIEFIDFFGLRTVSESAVRDVLPFREGEVVADPEAARAFGRELATKLGVADIELSFICCGPSGGTIVYVGVQETVAPKPSYRAAPSGDYLLRPEIFASYEAFGSAVFDAVRAGDAEEDHSAGHALSRNPALRARQDEFLHYASEYRDDLAVVIRESGNAAHRAAAALVLGYALDKKWAAIQLEAAAFDSDEGVRNNAIRGLAVIAEYEEANPHLGIEINYGRFIDLLNSMTWTDRNKGLFLLSSSRLNTREFALLRERALTVLIEMCRWRFEGHAIFACVLLARTLEIPEERAFVARHEVIAAGMARLAKGSH